MQKFARSNQELQTKFKKKNLHCESEFCSPQSLFVPFRYFHGSAVVLKVKKDLDF